MTERQKPEPNGERSTPRAVVMEYGSQNTQAFLYNEPGWLDLARESTSGLSPDKPGRSLVVTNEGRFAIVRGYLVDIEQSLEAGDPILQPLPRELRLECPITIGQEVTLGATHLPVVREVFIDRIAPARPSLHPALKLRDPFKGEVEAVIRHIGLNEKRAQRSLTQPPLKGNYL